jgi:hypothetical protein
MIVVHLNHILQLQIHLRELLLLQQDVVMPSTLNGSIFWGIDLGKLAEARPRIIFLNRTIIAILLLLEVLLEILLAHVSG